ncbi:MAG: MOSC domain-containing protein [Burkholderiales bacterium]|nr:MOSC domain-containing protein [Burkholderiales bacterium]
MMTLILAHAIFAGGRSIVGDGGHLTGLRKRRRDGDVSVNKLGIEGDEIVDRRNHGGPDRALNLFSFEHYGILQTLFPEAAEPLIAGSMGENITSKGLLDQCLYIGDIYRVGTVVFQISQPRSPCWKLNDRFGIAPFSKVLQEQHRTGCYARVLAGGTMCRGQTIELQARSKHTCSIASFWAFVLASKPDLEVLSELAKIEGLAEGWHTSLMGRIKWLHERSLR